ncbi:RNA polymerase sigma factor [Candidatus Poribacteria bacterium]|nr:RNA polymerase sigma factor [Candidatus Poribacteria bacterium]
MIKLDDETLVRRSVQGDESAFADLVRRYEHPLATLIRYQIGNPDHAEDILQETLLQAWLGLRHLREPKVVGAWLLQIARNRCYDFLKSAQRRDHPTEAVELEHLVNRFGRTMVRQRETVTEAVEVLEGVPPAERDVARLFYIEGFTIAEIAERHRCPEGTVKRRLFHARTHLRQAFEITEKGRKSEMSTRKSGTKKQPFPLRRPEIVITEIEAEPFSVDCPELRWWCIVPQIGERALFAEYSPPEWKVTRVYEMRGVRPAEVHGVEGIEIDVNRWEPGTGWMPSAEAMYGCLTDEKAQYLAVSQIDGGGKRWLYTFLDKHFDHDWGQMARKIEDRGRFVRQEDASLKQACRIEEPEESGAGIFAVRIGEKSFTCLRTLDLCPPVTNVDTPVTEGYMTQDGRTVMVRHYCQPQKTMINSQGGREGVVVDEKTQLTIDGVTFVHWYDSLSNLACG